MTNTERLILIASILLLLLAFGIFDNLRAIENYENEIEAEMQMHEAYAQMID